MTYRLHFACPRCNKQSETTQRHSWPLPDIKCGDCLMDDIEIVAMKCVGVQRLYGTNPGAANRGEDRPT